MNGPSVGAPGWAAATHFYGNLQWIRKSVNARRAAAARRRICRVTPPVKEVLFVHYLLGSTWGELTLRSMTSPRCSMTGWACWAGLGRGRSVGGGAQGGAIVNTGGGEEGGKGTHTSFPLGSPHGIPLGKRSAGSSHRSREDGEQFHRESQQIVVVALPRKQFTSLKKKVTASEGFLRFAVDPCHSYTNFTKQCWLTNQTCSHQLCYHPLFNHKSKDLYQTVRNM